MLDIVRWSLLLLLFAPVACGDDPVEDTGPEDSGVRDASDAGSDGGARDSGADAGFEDLGPRDASEAFGFTLRVPTEHEVPCVGMFCGGATIRAVDVDVVCDLKYGGLDHYVYVQANPVQQLDFMGLLYEVEAAFVSDGTTATPATAIYNWGGNHHNDSITIDVTTYEVRYDHSSFGFGFRQCQPMDCIVVYEPGPGAELANGCGRDRSVPAICKMVTRTGTVPEWVDTFRRCPGDT